MFGFNSVKDWCDEIKKYPIENISDIKGLPTLSEGFQFESDGEGWIIIKHPHGIEISDNATLYTETISIFSQDYLEVFYLFDKVEAIFNAPKFRINAPQNAQPLTLKTASIYYDNNLDTLFLFNPTSAPKPKCSCGAKHTSNPNYHLPYCDIKDKK